MNRADARDKVRVGAMVGFAYRSVFGRLGLVLDLGWVMLLALMVVLILPAVLLPNRYGGDALRFTALDYGRAAVALLALSAFAVRWYQAMLVGDPHRLPPGAFFRGWLRFLAYSCVVYLAVGLVAAAAIILLSELQATAATGGAIELAAILVALMLGLALLRLGLLFPAAASGVPVGPITAWRLMRGNTWRLAFASILAVLPVTIAAGVLTAIVIGIALPDGLQTGTTPPLGFAILTGLIETAANILLVALGASLLSGFYRELVARRMPIASPSQR